MNEISALQTFTAVAITGDDARKYLQGQLSNDVRKLSPELALLASHTSGQGRVQSILTLIERPEGLFAVISAQNVLPMIERMRRFVLRERVEFQAAMSDWVLAPLDAAQAATLGFSELPATPGACKASESATLLRWWSADERYLLLAQRAAFSVKVDPSYALDHAFHRADILAGLTSIHPETRDKFIPQVLNLDALGGISYEKGCYVGQEVVARARRSERRRRVQCFSCEGPAPAIGHALLSDGIAVGEVVDVSAHDGAGVLLAVVDVAKTGATLYLDNTSRSALTPLDLPYSTA